MRHTPLRESELAGLGPRYDAATRKIHLDGTATRLFLAHGLHWDILHEHAKTVADLTGHAVTICGADGRELLTVSEGDPAQKAGV